MGGGGRRDSLEAKFRGLKTRILDLGVSGRQHPTPYSSLALASCKMPVAKDSLLHCWGPLKRFPTLFPPQRLKLQDLPCRSSPPCLPQFRPPLPLPSAPQHSRPRSVPAWPVKPFSPARLPPNLRSMLLLCPAEQGKGGRLKKGGGQLRREGWSDPGMGTVPKRETEREVDGDLRGKDNTMTQIGGPLSCHIPLPWPRTGESLAHLRGVFPPQTHLPRLAQMSNDLKTEGKAVLRPR